MGAAVNALPGGEIVAAMDRGLLDAAEFNNASSDRVLGFADVSKVCMLQSYHQNAEQFEISFNKTKFDALPAKMRAIIANAVEAASQDMSWKAIDRYSQDYIELQTKDNVKFYKTPDAVLKKQLEVYDDVVKKKAAENPLFKEIVAVAARLRQARDAVGAGHGRQPPQDGFDHYFGPERQEADLTAIEARKSTSGPPGWCFVVSERLATIAAAMTFRAFLHTIDGVSTWVGKSAAWLIIVLMTVVCVEVFKRYMLNTPTAWIFDAENMLYGSLFMLCRRLHAGAERPCAGRLPLQFDAPAHAGLAGSRALRRLLPPRHRGPDLCRISTMPPNSWRIARAF